MEGSLAQTKGRTLNRDELSTYLQEAARIVNHTPMWEVSSQPTDPYLSPQLYS